MPNWYKLRKTHGTLCVFAVDIFEPCHSFNIFANMPEQLLKEQLIQAANDFGTPLYVYHAEKIKEQYEKLTSAFSIMDTKFFYASKALTNINILR